MTKKITPIIISLAGLLFLGGLCTQPVENQATNANPNSNVMQGKDGGLNPDSFTEEPLSEQEITDIVQNITLTGVNGFEGSGSASRYFENEFVLNIEAELMEPPAGMYYEGWIEKKDGDLISVGKLEKSGNVYMLEYNNRENMNEYTEVIISEETEENSEDNKIETKVLQGAF